MSSTLAVASAAKLKLVAGGGGDDFIDGGYGGGARGGLGFEPGPGGGGGSFVFSEADSPLIAAGGGGGAGPQNERRRRERWTQRHRRGSGRSLWRRRGHDERGRHRRRTCAGWQRARPRLRRDFRAKAGSAPNSTKAEAAEAAATTVAEAEATTTNSSKAAAVEADRPPSTAARAPAMKPGEVGRGAAASKVATTAKSRSRSPSLRPRPRWKPRHQPRTNHSLTYTATVSPIPSGGTVAFKNGGSTISGCSAQTVSLSTGEATCTTEYSTLGVWSVTAEYSGSSDTIHPSSTSSEKAGRGENHNGHCSGNHSTSPVSITRSPIPQPSAQFPTGHR